MGTEIASVKRLAGALIELGFGEVGPDRYYNGYVIVEQGPCGPAVYLRGEYIGGFDTIAELVTLLRVL